LTPQHPICILAMKIDQNQEQDKKNSSKKPTIHNKTEAQLQKTAKEKRLEEALRMNLLRRKK
jgi:hypothetical protein